MKTRTPVRHVRRRHDADRLDYLLTLQRDTVRGEALPLLLVIR